jgi:hypothetical protein
MTGGREVPNGIWAAPPVGVGEQLVDVDPEPLGELSPDRLDDRCGVDDRPVHVEAHFGSP